MKVLKKTDDYTIYQKRSGRMGVRDADKNWVNGEDKVRILVEAKLLEIKLPEPKAEEPEAEEATESEGSEESAEGETPSEE